MHDTLRYKMTGDERQDDAQRAQLLKGLAELALMSLLDEAPRYGLEILDALRRDAGLALAEGTIYPLLHRLERAKLTRAEWRLDEAGARPRKYYALTKQGRTELARQLAEWKQVSTSLGKFLERRKR